MINPPPPSALPLIIQQEQEQEQEQEQQLDTLSAPATTDNPTLSDGMLHFK